MSVLHKGCLLLLFILLDHKFLFQQLALNLILLNEIGECRVDV